MDKSARNLINFEQTGIVDLVSDETLPTETCLKFCIHMISEKWIKNYMEDIVPAIVSRSVSETEMCQELLFLLASIEEVARFSGIAYKHALCLFVHNVIQLLATILHCNKNWYYAKESAGKILGFIRSFVSPQIILEIVKELVYAIDMFVNTEFRKDYYWFLYELSKKYSVILSTGINGELIVTYDSLKVISKKPVTTYFIYPEYKKAWILRHLPDGWIS